MNWVCYRCGCSNNDGYKYDGAGEALPVSCGECGWEIRNRDEYVELRPLKIRIDGIRRHVEPIATPTSPPTVNAMETLPDEPVTSHSRSIEDRAYFMAMSVVTKVSVLTVLLVLTFFAVVFVKAFSG